MDFDPTRGSETQKRRPAVVVSSDAMGNLPVRIVVPITEWRDRHGRYLWRVRLEPDGANGLEKTSAADSLQVRCVALERFLSYMGRLHATQIAEIAAAIAGIVEFQ